MRIAYIVAACLILVTFMQAQERERDQPAPTMRLSPAARKLRLQQATAQLKLVVNDSASVENECKRGANVIHVLERSTITELEGCHLVLRTNKTTRLPGGDRDVEFITSVDIADLTTPVSVDAQSFASCTAKNGPIWKVSSNVGPGKKIRVTRQLRDAKTAAGAATAPSDITRRDVTFFFADPAPAKKAARLLDRAVKLCGGDEWPDEDDLP